MRSTLLFFLALALSFTGRAQVVAVTSSLGAAGANYSTLKAAFDAINAGTHMGTIGIVLNGNTTETASAVLNANGAGSAFYTKITITPAGGVTRTISGSIAGALIDLNGADNVVFNGLNTGGNGLTITNTNSTTGIVSTIRFIGDASNNKITNCTVKGASKNIATGTIFFSTGTTTGNISDTVSNCIVSDATSTPAIGIYSEGTTGMENSNILISNNEIANFFSSALANVAGIQVAAGSTGWTIQNNKIYQAASRTMTVAYIVNGISVKTGSGYTVSGNVIGFSDAAGTGTFTYTGNAGQFHAISLAVGTASPSSVQGNTVSGINFTSSTSNNTTGGTFAGIYVAGGDVNVGTVTPNTIGAASGMNAILTSASGSSSANTGIFVGGTANVVNIQNNLIGSIGCTHISSGSGSGVSGIYVASTTVSLNITNNTIGNTTADNMYAGTTGVTNVLTQVSGIILTSAVAALNISGNTIQNFNSLGPGNLGNGHVRGIATSVSSSHNVSYKIRNNTIRNLSCAGSTVGASNGQAAAVGINVAAGTNDTISGNTIYNIQSTNANTSNYYTVGITFGAGTSTVAYNNTIYGLGSAGTGTTATNLPVIAGMLIAGATTEVTLFNNMISIGDGTTANAALIGIMSQQSSSGTPNHNIYNNTVNVTGTASGSSPSFGFLRGNLTTTQRIPNVNVRNNIFTNDRTGTGKHYAIGENYNSTASATGWAANASNNNILNADAATIGYWNADMTFAAWQAASASDASSYSGIPVTYVNAANDLHLNMGTAQTYIESRGASIANMTKDIDGDARPGPAGSVNGGGVAPDMGADEIDAVPYPLNAAPAFVSSTPQTLTVCQNAAATSIASLLHVNDADAGQTLTWTVQSPASHGTATLTGATAASGTANVTPGGTLTYTPTNGYNGSDAFTIRVSDGTATADMVVNVTVNALPNVNAGTDVAVCTGGSVTLTGSGAASYTWNNGVTNGVSFIPSSTATYTVTGTGANTCTKTDQVVVTVNSLPNVNAGTDFAVCAGQTATLNGAGATSYTWNNGVTDGVSFTPSSTTTYTVTGTDGNNCTNTDAVVVTVNSLPSVNAGTDFAVCASQTATLSGSGATSYTWSNGVTNGVSFTPSSTTTYTVTGTDGNNCTNTDAVVVTVNSLPSVNAGTDFSVCAGQTATLSGSGATSYTWNNGVTNGVSFTPSSTTTYTVTGTDGNNCTNTDAVVVTVNSLPTVNAGTDFAVCAGQTATLSGSGATSYTWSNGVTDGVSFTPSSTTTYTVTGTDGNNCTNTDAVVVTVNSLPNVNAGTDFAVCAGQTATLNGSGATSYTWNNGVTDGVSFTPSSTTTYTVTGTDGNNCTNTDAVVVTVNSLPNVNAGTDFAVCAGQTATLSGSGATSYTWNNGVTDGVSFTPSSTTTYTVTGTDGNNCTNTDAVVVTVNALPNVNAGTDFSVCAGQTATLNGSGATSYTWNNGVTDGVSFTPSSTTTYTVTGTDGNNCTNTDAVVVTVNSLPNVNAGTDFAVCAGQTATLNGSGATSYTWNNGVTDGVSFTPSSTTTYTVTGTDGNNCTNTDAVVVTVNALPNVNAGTDATVCIGSSVTLNGTGANSYSWSNGVNNGVAFVPGATTTYTVTGTGSNGCTNTDDVTINVHAPVITYASNNICKGDTITLNAPAGTGYLWKKNGVKVNNQTTSALKLYTAGTGNYTVTFTDAICGLFTTPAVAATVNALPAKPKILGAAATCPGVSTVLTGNTGFSSYAWSLNGVPYATTTTATLGTATGGDYTLTVADVNGCVSLPSAAKKLTISSTPTSSVSVMTTYTNGSVRLTSTNNASYQWLLDGTPIAGATGRYYTAIQSGTYAVAVTGQSGCVTTSAGLPLTINYTGPKDGGTVGVGAEEMAAISVMPNPSAGVFYIQSSEPVTAVVRDLQGKVVVNERNAVSVDLTEQAAGIYILQLFNSAGEMVLTEKLSKQ